MNGTVNATDLLVFYVAMFVAGVAFDNVIRAIWNYFRKQRRVDSESISVLRDLRRYLKAGPIDTDDDRQFCIDKITQALRKTEEV